jgi:two-component system, NarL family, invasion response regulator UvrY
MYNSFSPRILIVDDHHIVISGIKLLLKDRFPLAQVEGILNVKNVFSKLSTDKFDLIILDINMPGADTHNIIHTVKENYKGTKILVFSMNEESVFAKRYLKLGVDGYLSKEASDVKLLDAVSRVLDGGRYLSDTLINSIAYDFLEGKSDNVLDTLSDREFEIMKYLIQGRGVKEISQIVCLHHSTISTHKARIFEKTGATNIIELQRIVDLQ